MIAAFAVLSGLAILATCCATLLRARACLRESARNVAAAADSAARAEMARARSVAARYRDEVALRPRPGDGSATLPMGTVLPFPFIPSSAGGDQRMPTPGAGAHDLAPGVVPN